MKRLAVMVLGILGAIGLNKIIFGAAITTATLATTTAYKYVALCSSSSVPIYVNVSTTSYNNYRNNGTPFIVPASSCTSAGAFPIYNTPTGRLDPGSYTEYPLGTYHIPRFTSTVTGTGTLTVISGEVTTTTVPTPANLELFNN